MFILFATFKEIKSLYVIICMWGERLGPWRKMQEELWNMESDPQHGQLPTLLLVGQSQTDLNFKPSQTVLQDT